MIGVFVHACVVILILHKAGREMLYDKKNRVHSCDEEFNCLGNIYLMLSLRWASIHGIKIEKGRLYIMYMQLQIYIEDT